MQIQPGITHNRRDLVLLGGGHTHIEVIRGIGMRPEPGLRVSVLSRDVMTPYSGMLPGLVAGHYRFSDCHIDLRALCAWANVRLIQTKAENLDPSTGTIYCQNRAPVRYDLLSINIGSSPALDSVDGAAATGVAVKPVARLIPHLERLIASLRRAPREICLAVVGGGAASIELALATRYRLRQSLGVEANRVSIELLTLSDVLLPAHNIRVRQAFVRHLASQDVRVRYETRIIAANKSELTDSNGDKRKFDDIFWAIHAGAPGWLRGTGLALDDDGFVAVDSRLRSVSHDNVFAAGDIASLPPGLAKSGVYAVRQGPVLASNLRAAHRGSRLRRYRPQARFLSLLITGERHAVASRGRWFVQGRWVWHWKDWIDRRFMQRYQLNSDSDSSTESAMRCGGCGAKIGPAVLGRALAELTLGFDASVVVGLSASDDAAVLDLPADRQLVQSVDYLRDFISDPWLLGRIAVTHCVGDLHAMGAVPHSALAIAALPYASAHLVERDLSQLMQGAAAGLREEGMSLIGGHSSESAEMGFGLAVNGLLAPGWALLKGPLSSGQALVLTKALGSGTLLAANMRGLAKGNWIQAALEAMCHSQAGAAAVARQFPIAACTDITGFGLFAHLQEMLRGSTCGLRLFANALPVLDGALECLAGGIESTLAPANRAQAGKLIVSDSLVDPALQALLFDPQTAGGLLFAADLVQADALCAALQGAGYKDVSLIGETWEGLADGEIHLTTGFPSRS